ncbi:MAG: peptidoglycan bridge formation glycyltransferase FemA/FemB family protein [Chloroflexi bacterium]|nr:peptidoglycan bridge formation glycyltransferase FemA/FemB family protein [Chloroflexota bacterium]
MTRPPSLSTIADAALWDNWLAAQNGSILQTAAWGALKQQFGWQAERVAFASGGEIHAAAQILYRPLAPALTIAYIPRGPVLGALESLAPFLQAITQHVRQRGAFLLKLEPDWQRGDVRDDALRAANAQPTAETIQPSATIHLDLTADLDTLLARMKPKWRYNIRLAEKKAVVVRAGSSADIPAFYILMQLTGARDHFAIHGIHYYRAAFELLAARDHVRLFVAEFENKPLAMIFVTAFAQQAIYLYGASSNAERNRMPNHALHWAAMQWAKARGCTHYDLWGVPDAEHESSDAENLPSSLHQFKQGFGGTIIRYSGAWDMVFDPVRYKMYQLARRIRKSGLG